MSLGALAKKSQKLLNWGWSYGQRKKKTFNCPPSTQSVLIGKSLTLHYYIQKVGSFPAARIQWSLLSVKASSADCMKKCTGWLCWSQSIDRLQYNHLAHRWNRNLSDSSIFGWFTCEAWVNMKVVEHEPSIKRQ